MACNKEIFSSHMVLNIEELSLFDLYHIFFSRDLHKRKFVDLDCPEGTEEENFRPYRWIIFISVLAQKFLQSVAKPLSWFGSAVELWLNLLSCNLNSCSLLLNFLRGKVDKETATYLSFIGLLDKRKELDRSIKHGDSRYYGALSVMAAKISYENKAYIATTVRDHWKMEFLGSYDFRNDYQEKDTTQAFILQDKNADPNMIVVAFRGTEPYDAYAWCSDFDISWFELPDMGKIHGGFMKALGLPKEAPGLQNKQGWPKEYKEEHPKPLAYYAIREKLRELMRVNDRTKFIVTGHSLGGALAILFPAILALHEEEWMLKRLEGVYTYGQPRVGDEKFGKFMQEQLKKYGVHYYRFVYCNDIVPRLPFDDKALMFKHFGTCLFYNSFYGEKILLEEPNKNYFSLVWAIPKTINAVWELIRSFIIPYAEGPDYREGLLLKLFRLTGLVIAGLPAHAPPDYVNSTRLGSSYMFLPHQDHQESTR